MWIKKVKSFLPELFFPKFCLHCRAPGSYLCQDCLSLIDFSTQVLKNSALLSSLYFAADYQSPVVRPLLQKFKYPPFARQLAQDLVSVIITYLENLEKKPVFLTYPQDYLIVAAPLHKRKLKKRGFNQSLELAKILAQYYHLPLLKNGLIKIKATAAQIDLTKELRKINLKNAFTCPHPELIKEKRILLIDDVFTTGATLEECARILHRAKAKQVIGLVVAHG